MSIREDLYQAIKNSLSLDAPHVLPDFQLEIPPEESMGDFACNVAMVMAKPLKSKPRDLAQQFKEKILQSSDYIESIEIAGPGFLNISIKRETWVKALREIYETKTAFGASLHYKGRKALIEFVSANPTGPLHVGHGRGAVVGDVLGNVLKAVGYDVVKEYYVNDGGIQIATLGKSVWVRLRQMNGEDIAFPENAYQGDYIKDIARELNARLADFDGWDEARIIHYFGTYAGDKILEEIKSDLANTGIVFDHYFFESTLYQEGKVNKTLEELAVKKLSYQKDEALWLDSKKFGDDKDRVLIKSDGNYTYLTPDIAYHRDKFSRGPELLINVWGADHGGYVPRLKAALKGLGYPVDQLHVVLIQMVSLIKGGELLSMSTRRAQYETLESVVKAVGRDVTRYFFMMRSFNAQLDFDVELAAKQGSENPVYYIQYAHARICSIFSKAAEEQKSTGYWLPYEADFENHLELPEEISLAKMILGYPDLVKQAAIELSPHRIGFFVLELAREFQSYYDRARGDDRYKILSAEPERIKARLFLLGCIRQVLQNGLAILGVSTPEKM